MTSKLFKVLFLSLFLVVSNSCKKDKPDPPLTEPTEKTITLITDNVEPGQIVLAQANEAITINPGAKVSVNGQDAAAFDAGNNQVGFLMPVLPAGKTSVDYTNIGINKTLTLTVKEYQQIIQPVTAISNFTSEMDKSIKNLETHMQDEVTGINAEDIELLKYLNQNIKDNINNLNEQEKIQLAYYLRINTPDASNFILDSVKSEFILGKKSSATDPGEILVKKALSYDKNLFIGVPTVIAGWGFAIITTPTLLEKVAATGLLTTGLVHLMAAQSDASYIANLTGVAERIEEPLQKQAEKIILKDGLEDEVYFKAIYRTINHEDSKSQNKILKMIFDGNIKLQYGYNTSVDLANKVISWFPWKSPKIPQYTNPIGTKTGSREINLPGTKIVLDKVSNPAIKVLYTKYADHLVIKASSETIDKETDFNFNVKFTDDALGITLEKQIEATLKPKVFSVLDDENKWVVTPVKFISGKGRSFFISEDKMTKANGIDYSEITINNKTSGSKIQVVLDKNSGSFTLIPSHQENEMQYANIEIFYKGKFVQTVGIEVEVPCQGILGSWRFQGYMGCSALETHPDGKPEDFYWNMTIYDNGKLNIVASSDGTSYDFNYSLNGNCSLSFNFFGCVHGFTLEEGVNEYRSPGCGCNHHYTFTKQ